jgi:hypothetical protein
MSIWLAKFSEHYRQPISKISALVFKEELCDLTPEQLDVACREVIRTSEYMPTTATIRNALKRIQDVEVDYVPPRTVFPEVKPEDRVLTPAEEQHINELKAKIFNIGDKRTKTLEEQKAELKKRGFLP